MKNLSPKKKRLLGILLIVMPIIFPILIVLVYATIRFAFFDTPVQTSELNSYETSSESGELFGDENSPQLIAQTVINIIVFVSSAAWIIGFIPSVVTGVRLLSQALNTHGTGAGFIDAGTQSTHHD